MNLPDRIRAIPCKVPAYENAYGAYERGHRAALNSAAALAEGTGEADAERRDLAMLVRRLCRRCDDPKLVEQANDYLRRKGLQGSPLR